jgi:hypothetical protein
MKTTRTNGPLAAVVAALFVLSPLPTSAKKPASKPVSVFAELEGRWRGVFVGYGATGEELYRIDVTQTFVTIDDFTQTVTIEDRMQDGTVVKTTGKHVARRNDAGALSISVDLTKSNGDRVRHTGRLIKGPRGETQFIWYSVGADRSETFRETVVREGPDTVYLINGMGRYGDKLILMTGRYVKVPAT